MVKNSPLATSTDRSSTANWEPYRFVTRVNERFNFAPDTARVVGELIVGGGFDDIRLASSTLSRQASGR
jgi:hypothetical protein